MTRSRHALGVAMLLTGSMTVATRHVVAAPFDDSGGYRLAPQGCRVVQGKTLETYLPVMPGWSRTEPVTETDGVESVSRTTVDYDRGLSTMSVEIMDSCRRPEVLGPMTTALKEGVPVTAGTTAKSLAVQGFPAYEEWTAAEGNGELHVLVGGRFMIKITAGTSDLSTMENTAARMALQKLATQQ